jgi:hypothetical protein
LRKSAAFRVLGGILQYHGDPGPVVFAMDYEPATQPGSLSLMEVGNQLKWGLVGLMVSVLMLGWILSRFIPKTAVRP